MKSASETLYSAIAGNIEAQIRNGALRAGDRLTSIRKMSGLQGVSISTVLQAYLDLESRGLIEAKPQSGFFVSRTAHASLNEPEATFTAPISSEVAISDLVANFLISARNSSLVPLGTACPSPELFPSTRLNQILRELTREFPLHSSEYEISPGTFSLRRQIARRSIQWGCKLSPSEVVMTSGGLEAVNLCLRAIAEPGDTIAVESPTYFGTLQSIESLKMRALEIPCHPQRGMDLDILEQALLKTKVKACIVISNFNNPLGSLMPEENKKRLVDMLIPRGIPIIEEDFYGDLGFNDVRPNTIKSLDPDGSVLLCSSFSKTLAPGFRIGWTSPGRYQAQVERLKFMSTIATPSLSQLVIAEYLESGGYDRHIRKLRQALFLQIQRVRQTIFQCFPEGTKVTRPEGGFVLWVELPGQVDSIQLQQLALQRKISILPGPIFSASGKYRNFIRLNCGNVWTSKIEQALLTLGKLTKQLAGSSSQ